MMASPYGPGRRGASRSARADRCLGLGAEALTAFRTVCESSSDARAHNGNAADASGQLRRSSDRLRERRPSPTSVAVRVAYDDSARLEDDGFDLDEAFAASEHYSGAAAQPPPKKKKQKLQESEEDARALPLVAGAGDARRAFDLGAPRETPFAKWNGADQDTPRPPRKKPPPPRARSRRGPARLDHLLEGPVRCAKSFLKAAAIY